MPGGFLQGTGLTPYRDAHSPGVNRHTAHAWRRAGKPMGTCRHCGHRDRAYHFDPCQEREYWGQLECTDAAACERRLQFTRELHRLCRRHQAA